MITLRQGAVVAGRYALVRELARGGMGSVWIARHRDLEIDVGVKFMAPSLVASTEARVRFEREAKVAARLGSQHVVQVHDYGVADDMPYFVMELLKGESLATRLKRDGRLSMQAAATIVSQACKALRTAHEFGLVHRDLKPGNIFLAQKDGDEVVKVLDFGVAKIEGIDLKTANTESGVLLGTLHYMSPEQIRSSRQVDHRSDLWSMGVIIYRMITGRLPFPGPNMGDVLVRICTDPIDLATVASPDLPPAVDTFFERALAREAEERFQGAVELSEAFAAVASGAAAKPKLVVQDNTQTVVLDRAAQEARTRVRLSSTPMQVAPPKTPGWPPTGFAAADQPSMVVAVAPAALPPQAPVVPTVALAEPPRSTPHSAGRTAGRESVQPDPGGSSSDAVVPRRATLPFVANAASSERAVASTTHVRGPRATGLRARPLLIVVAVVTAAGIFFIVSRSGRSPEAVTAASARAAPSVEPSGPRASSSPPVQASTAAARATPSASNPPLAPPTASTAASSSASAPPPPVASTEAPNAEPEAEPARASAPRRPPSEPRVSAPRRAKGGANPLDRRD